MYTTAISNFQKYLDQDTIKRLNCVMVYFNTKVNDYLVEIINLQLCGKLKGERSYKIGHVELDPVF